VSQEKEGNILMKGILIKKINDNFDRALDTSLPEPDVAENQILVEVHYGGLNYADLMMCNGSYPHPKGYPLQAGIEFSGIVVKCGSNTKKFSLGDRVAGFSEEAGAFSEFLNVPEDSVTKLIDDVSLQAGAAYYVQTTTAYHLLHTIGKVQKNDIVLIHAIGGGVGLNLTQLAKHSDATVIGTVGTSGKETRAVDCGADLVVNRATQDFKKEIQQKFGKTPVRLLVDSTGADILNDSFDLMQNLGHVVSYGEASGKPFDNLWAQLVLKSLTFSRLHIGHINHQSEDWLTSQKVIQKMIQNGSLNIFIEHIFTLEEFNQAYQALESRQVSGKVLLRLK
jgi:NADPH2:quinone reductase